MFPLLPAAQIEASDLMLELLELQMDNGEIFITEVDGTPLQFIRPPFVASLFHAEARRNLLRRLVSARAKKRFRGLGLPSDWMEHAQGPGYQIRRIPYIHPEAMALTKSDPRFRFRRRSVFDRSSTPGHVIRTMNIFNRSYFSTEQLEEGYRAIFDSLRPGGIWVVGRTLEEDLSNHASVFRRGIDGLEILDRVGNGWEMEEMALGLFR
jgi:hypothetical protein